MLLWGYVKYRILCDQILTACALYRRTSRKIRCFNFFAADFRDSCHALWPIKNLKSALSSLILFDSLISFKISYMNIFLKVLWIRITHRRGCLHDFCSGVFKGSTIGVLNNYFNCNVERNNENPDFVHEVVKRFTVSATQLSKTYCYYYWQQLDMFVYSVELGVEKARNNAI